MLLTAAPYLPSREVLRVIAAKLSHDPVQSARRFQKPGARHAADPVCNMRRFTVTRSAGSASARSLPLLLDQGPANAEAPVTFLTVLGRISVDGSPRTHHPDDPQGKAQARGKPASTAKYNVAASVRFL